MNDREYESGTSGQHDPKSGDNKFREKSNIPKHSEQLHEGEKPPSGEAGHKNHKKPKFELRMEKSVLRSEKTGSRLEEAKQKKAKQKPLKRPGIVKTAKNAVQFETWRHIHGKVNQVEQENAGTEAAHKIELAGETAVRGSSRFIKQRARTRPARMVHKWEKRDIRAKADLQYKKHMQEHPELKKGKTLSQFIQKQKLKRNYQKQAQKSAKKGTEAAKKTAKTAGKLVLNTVKSILSKPYIWLVIGVVLLLIVVMQACIGLFSSFGSGVTGVISGASYMADDIDIDKAELAYTEWEADLQLQINNMEADNPNYNEYKYNIGTIEHNPYELMAYLTAVYEKFTFDNVESALRNIFNEQYTLTTQEIMESQTETSTIDDYSADDNSDEEKVDEDYRTLEVNLTVKPFFEVVRSRMSSEQLERYSLYVETKGNRQYLYSPFATDWISDITCSYGYRVHPVSGEKNYHKGIDISLPEGTDILAGQSGKVTFAGDNGDYGFMVIIEDDTGLISKYAHCSALFVSTGQAVDRGNIIAKVGNTGNSIDPHLHLEILKNNEHLNPVFFVLTNDFNV